MNRRYDFLDKTLNALVVDDEWISQALVSELLSHVNIFEISTASRCAEAVTVLRSRRIHLCILDLGINDIDNDEFYLLRTYAKTCSIIVLTASTSPQKGGLCMELGARAILEKRAPFDNRTFIINSNRYALLNIINPYYRERAGDTLGLTTKVLFEKDPRSVTEWADCLRITDRQLRNLWNSGTGAKSILFLYNLYRKAFDFYENTYFPADISSPAVPDPVEYRKMAEYYISHKDLFHKMLS